MALTFRLPSMGEESFSTVVVLSDHRFEFVDDTSKRGARAVEGGGRAQKNGIYQFRSAGKRLSGETN